MSGDKLTKVTLEQRARDLIAGTLKHFANEVLAFGGATYAGPVLAQLLQGLIDAMAAADQAKAAWDQALKSMRDSRAKVVPILGDYQSYLVNRFGQAPSTLADFGVAPRKKPTPLTAEQRATAAQKAAATRVLRHTMGKKAKAAIKAPAASPVAAPAAPATGSATKPAS